MDVVGDEGYHSGPVELSADVLDRFGDTRVTSQAVIVVGAQDV